MHLPLVAQMYLQRTAHQEVAEAFTQNMPHHLKTLFTGTNVIAELLPLLNRIVAPDLKPVRPVSLDQLLASTETVLRVDGSSSCGSRSSSASQVNSQVVKNDERARLLRLVNTMITTKLAFVLDKSEDGQLSFKLDPCVPPSAPERRRHRSSSPLPSSLSCRPIDVFVHYEGKRPTDIAPGRFAVRQMINREVRASSLSLSRFPRAPVVRADSELFLQIDQELLRRGDGSKAGTKSATEILDAYKACVPPVLPLLVRPRS